MVPSVPVPVLAPARRSLLGRLRPATLAAALAGLALLALAAALVVGVGRGDHPAAAPAGSPVTAASLPAVQRSGADYTAPTLPPLVRRLVARSAAPARSGAPLGPRLEALAGSPAAVAACLRAAAGPDFGVPVALDAARYAGAPALVAVYPAPARAGQLPRWQALVVDPACAPGEFRYFAQFTR